MRGAFWLLLFLSLACFVAGSLLNVDINKQHRLPFDNDEGLFHTHKLSRIHDEIVRRGLLQENPNTCAWDATAEQCFLTAGTVLSFLGAVDNPLSTYLYRAIRCGLQFDEDDCEQQHCSWNGLYCEIPHEEFREFISVPCLNEVRHIVDIQANAIQCDALHSRDSCERVDVCSWRPDVNYCLLDHWFYHHGIPMTDFYPEGYWDVYDERADQLNADIDEAQANGNITHLMDVPEFGPSEFDCPSGYSPVLCDFVDALTPLMLTDYYCGYGYPSSLDEAACDLDVLCQPTYYSPCEAADFVLYDARRAANIRFANHIEDPEARKHDLQDVKCAYTFEEEECKGNCIWTNDFCSLSPRWVEEEVYRLVGETNNRVCQFYTSDVETGCIDHETPEACTEDRQCVWLGDYNSCESGLFAWMDIALRGSDEAEDFREAKNLCFESSYEECGPPDQADEDVDDSYTFLSGAIGSNYSVISLVF